MEKIFNLKLQLKSCKTARGINSFGVGNVLELLVMLDCYVIYNLITYIYEYKNLYESTRFMPHVLKRDFQSSTLRRNYQSLPQS